MTLRRLDEPPKQSLLQLLQARQTFVVDRVPRFAIATGILAAVFFISTALVQWWWDKPSAIPMSLEALKNPTAGLLIYTFLALFCQYLTWLFAIWSVAFVPYVALVAHGASKRVTLDIEFHRTRWIQLGAATILPAFVFALFYGTAADQGTVSTLPTTAAEGVGVLLAAAVTGGVLSLINLLISAPRVDLKLAMFSGLLYLSLYLHYGQGIGLVSQAVLLGILGYIWFAADQVRELIAGMATFDLNPKTVEKLNALVDRRQDLRGVADETALRREEIVVEAERKTAEIEAKKVEDESAIEAQIASIQGARVKLTTETHKAMLVLFQRQLDDYQTVFSVYSGELDERVKRDRERRIELLKGRASELPSDKLAEELKAVVGVIHRDFDGVPEALEELHARMIEVTDKMKRQTLALIESKDADSDETTKK